jgi:hypothetical protein
MLPPMRPRLAPWACKAIVPLFVLGLTSPVHADSYEDGDEESEPPGSGPEVDPAGPAPDEALTAGGLEVPDSFHPADEQGDEVTRELEEADRRDSQRGLEFAWLVGDVGLGVLDAAGLDRGQLLAPGDPSGGVGVAYGGGLGVRLLYFTLGARLAGSDVGTLRTLGGGGELGMKLPLGNLEPLLVLDLGYVSVAGLAAAQTLNGLSDVDGLSLNVGAGVDYYLSDHFSLGASARFGAMFLGRPPQDPANFVGEMDPVYAVDANATGTSFALALRIGFHL